MVDDKKGVPDLVLWPSGAKVMFWFPESKNFDGFHGFKKGFQAFSGKGERMRW